MDDSHEWLNSSDGLIARIKKIHDLYKARRMLPKINGEVAQRRRAQDKKAELEKDFAAIPQRIREQRGGRQS
eukprot:250031-Prymnesium_polylepis.1